MKRKYYLIDTENVGDRWFDLLQKTKKKDRIITFYTEHHSKHLEGYLMKQVHNSRIIWLECVAGNNALDYQLMGVLSYLIAKHPKASYYIYSNDRDYQSTIDFWQSRGIAVCRKGFAIKNGKKTAEKKEKKKKAPKSQKTVVEILTTAKAKKVPGTLLKTGQEKPTEEQYVIQIAKCVPVTDLGAWYQALTSILGQENGRNWYLKVRGDAKLRKKLSEYCIGEEDERGVNLVAMVLDIHGLDVTGAKEAYNIIQSHSRRNLKAIKADFDMKFGKKPQQEYYKVLRPLFKVIKGK